MFRPLSGRPSAVRSHLLKAQSSPFWNWQTGLNSLHCAVLWIREWAERFDLSCPTRGSLKSPWPAPALWACFLCAAVSACYACKGQNLHLEELVIKTQQEPVNVRIEDRFCGQGERGWQVRTCSSGGYYALFPPLWLSSTIKGMILKIQDIVHVLKLSEMLMSNLYPIIYLPDISCVCYR